MVYKVRVILNAEENVIRDIVINKTDSLEDLHNAVINAFGFEGGEMASFYRSDNEWNHGEEFPLSDMSEVQGSKIQMSEIGISDILILKNDKLIYVYDFFNMWMFYVELMETNNTEPHRDLPFLQFSLGNIPNSAPDLKFESEDLGMENYGSEVNDEFDFDNFDEILN